MAARAAPATRSWRRFSAARRAAMDRVNPAFIPRNHRIEEAKAALADPAQAEVPVITIAMDAGFQSLGPFNRAFKATTGVTPTEYRKLKATAA